MCKLQAQSIPMSRQCSVNLPARMSMDVDGRTLIHEVVLADIKADRLVHIA